jgi:hypothetical protein
MICFSLLANDKVYNYAPSKSDKVTVIPVWFLVNPKALNPEDNKLSTEFHEFKKQRFTY